MQWEQYFWPGSAQEALGILEKFQGEAHLLAGGTDLVLKFKQKKYKTKALVDLRDVQELNYIKEEDGLIKIGSLTTHTQLANSNLLKKKARVLATAAQSVGSPQIRNLGTIGGNVVNAQPAADTSIALTALDASARILKSEGEVTKKVSDLFISPGKSAVDPTREIVTSFEFRIPGDEEATAFVRFARRKALALPILNIGVWIKLNATKTEFVKTRIAIGPVALTPFRAQRAEAELAGASVKRESLLRAATIAVEEVNPRDSIRGSSVYRKELVKVLLPRALSSAVKYLGGEVS